MRHKFTSAIFILLLVSECTACSLLRPRRAFAWHILLETESSVADREGVIRRTVSVIEHRLEAAGVQNFEVVAQGSPPNGRILLNLPEVSDRPRLLKLITVVGQLELTAIVSPPSPAPVQTYNTKEEAIASLGEAIPENRGVLPYSEGNEPVDTPGSKTARKWVVIARPAIIDGVDLRDAVASRTPEEGYAVAFSLKPEGAEKFGVWTGSHMSEYLGVALNGEEVDRLHQVSHIRSRRDQWTIHETDG